MTDKGKNKIPGIFERDILNSKNKMCIKRIDNILRYIYYI